jgi:hypothetical protein
MCDLQVMSLMWGCVISWLSGSFMDWPAAEHVVKDLAWSVDEAVICGDLVSGGEHGGILISRWAGRGSLWSDKLVSMLCGNLSTDECAMWWSVQLVSMYSTMCGGLICWGACCVLIRSTEDPVVWWSDQLKGVLRDCLISCEDRVFWVWVRFDQLMSQPHVVTWTAYECDVWWTLFYDQPMSFLWGRLVVV